MVHEKGLIKILGLYIVLESKFKPVSHNYWSTVCANLMFCFDIGQNIKSWKSPNCSKKVVNRYHLNDEIVNKNEEF